LSTNATETRETAARNESRLVMVHPPLAVTVSQVSE
jgi:hypothetical protein